MSEPSYLHSSARDHLPDRLPVSYFAHGNMSMQGSTHNVVGEPTNWRVIPPGISGELNIVFRDHYILHYFHAIEVFMSAYVFWREFLPLTRPVRIYFGMQAWNNPEQNNVQKKLLSLLFPESKVIEGPSQGVTVPLQQILFVDRGAAETDLNKFLQPMLPIAASWGMAFTQAVTGGIKRRGSLRCGYISRPPPRTMSDSPRTALLTCIAAEGYEIEIVDFSTMSFEAQVDYASVLDLLVGVHGNGLTNLLWLPTHAAVIEVFPRGFHCYDYQMLCEIRDLNYFGVDGENNRFTREWIRIGPPSVNPNNPIDVFSPAALAAVSGFLRRIH